MITVFSFLMLFIAIVLLCILAAIDNHTKLLPNIYVYPFAGLAVIFNILTDFTLTTPSHMLLGGLCGGGLLFAIRQSANAIYKTDTLGLGDVKLMGAAGLWLGLDYIFIALCLGACASVLHGLTYVGYIKIKTGKPISLNTLYIPAGPGFIAAILIVGYFKFQILLHLIPL